MKEVRNKNASCPYHWILLCLIMYPQVEHGSMVRAYALCSLYLLASYHQQADVFNEDFEDNRWCLGWSVIATSVREERMNLL